MEPLAPQLEALRKRIDGLRVGSPRRVAWWERPRGPHGPGQRLPVTPELTALDQALDASGIHTSADAELLFQLSVQTDQANRGQGPARLLKLSQGLHRRARLALRELQRQLAWVERAQRRAVHPGGSIRALEQGLDRLARVLKVADRFASQGKGAFEVWPASSRLPSTPGGVRLEAAAFFAGRARLEWEDVVQKRRDLEVANNLLRTLGSESQRSRAWSLRREVNESRDRNARSRPVRSVAESLLGMRSSGSQDTYPLLRELYERSVEAGNSQVAEHSREALNRFWSSSGTDPEPRRGEFAAIGAAAQQAHDRPLLEFLGVAPKTASGAPLQEGAPSEADQALAELAFGLDSEVRASFDLAAECARHFEIDEALGEEDAALPAGDVAASAQIPAPELMLETTGQLQHLRDFVITDPRLLWVDLAAHRQLVRRYRNRDESPGAARRGAVRVYVCDASGSMQGARARFRNAVLLAELNALRVRARSGRPFDPLYFCFFNDQPSKLVRVDSAEEALRQMQALFRVSPARGQTDISGALQTAFDSVRAARGKDAQLARAKVVLVTDGEDRIRLEEVRFARAGQSDLNIALSFISLGEENRELRSLAEEQRAAGERAFYYHLTDEEIGAVRTDFDRRFRTLIPTDWVTPAAGLSELRPHLDALEALAARREVVAPPPNAASFDAFFPVHPTPGSEWVPVEARERVRDILSVLAEVAPLSPAELRGRETVALLLHLLQTYEISLPGYLAALHEAVQGSETAAMQASEQLRRLRLLARPLT